MWGAIIGAGISAIGSLIGSKQKKQTTTTEVNYVKMAQNAMKAGFNPLTAIRNGGSAGFVNTHHPALSAHAGIGAAFQTIGNAIMSFDPRADERAALEQKLMEAQIGQLNASTSNLLGRTMAFGDVPTAAGSTRVGAGGKALGLDALAEGGKPEPGRLSVTNPFPKGSGFEVNPYVMDAESIEQRYGDIAQEAGGFFNMGADAWWNAIQQQKALDAYLKASGKKTKVQEYKEKIGSFFSPWTTPYDFGR